MKPQEHNPLLPNSENSNNFRETQDYANFKHSQAMKRRWQNPQFRERILAKLHSPEAKENSRLTRAKLYKKDPEIFERAAKTRSEHWLTQLRQTLGGDPKEILEDLYFKQGLSMNDIANRFSNDPETIRYWFQKFGITPRKLVREGFVTQSRAKELVLSAVENGTFEKLPQRWKDVLTLRYLHPGKSLTYSQISNKLSGISRQNAHEIENRALKFLQGNKPRSKSMLDQHRVVKAKGEHKLDQLRQNLGGDPKEVLDLYIKQGLSTDDIANRFHKTPQTVRNWFRTFGITRSERKLGQLKQLLGGNPKEVLEDLYIKQGLSMTDIAKRVHKSPMAVSNWFKRFGISAIQSNYGKKISESRKEHTLGQLELILGGDPKEVLEDLYIRQGLFQTDIAKRFHKHPVTVNKWLKKLGIETTRSDYGKKISKANSKRLLEYLRQMFGEDPKKILEDLYIKQGLSMTDIANRFYKAPETMRYWFKVLGITTNPHKRKAGGSINRKARAMVLSAIHSGSFQTLPQRHKELLIRCLTPKRKPGQV